MFKKSIVALVTPMDEKGNICQSSLKKLIDYHVTHGTSAIVSISTTGESTSLSLDERYNIVMLTLEFAENRIPIIVGISANTTAEAINLIKSFNKSNISGYLIVTPYYIRPTQEGLFQHFKKISEHTDLPQILYNIPSRTGYSISLEIVSRLSKIKNIVGIKETTRNLGRIRQLKEIVSSDFILLSGDDVTALDFMQLGGNGVISVTANVAAKDMAEMCNLAALGYYKKAREINQRLMPLHQKLFIEPNPIPVKYACKELGLISNNTLRLPMTPIAKHNQKIINSALKHLNSL